MERAASLVRRYGAPALLLSWVPLIGDAIVAAAGAARMNPIAFSLWTIAGKAARYAALAAIILQSR
jgi:membrane protein YqaA with SNARE-associated domain